VVAIRLSLPAIQFLEATHNLGIQPPDLKIWCGGFVGIGQGSDFVIGQGNIRGTNNFRWRWFREGGSVTPYGKE